MKRKSDYAFVITCNPGYSFGLIASMNAQMYFGTAADWEVAYEPYPNDLGLLGKEHREKISEVFPFNVTWTPVVDLISTMTVDNRTDKRIPVEKFWLGYWLMAQKVLQEGKYKAVCVIQADVFPFVNLDVYFQIAERGIMVSSESAYSFINCAELPFGDDEKIWNRSQNSLFDALNFVGPEHINIVIDTVKMQLEDASKEENNYTVITLNRSVCKHGQKNKILGLEARTWCCDCIWDKYRLHLVGDKVYNDAEIKINAWHCRWWQPGRVDHEWRANKEAVIHNKNNREFIARFDNQEHNYNLVKSFMERFNDMTPEIRSEEYLHGLIRRPRYELGEE